ncbi:MAG: dihydrofolate reductase [Ulvibacter sp.]|jgi:dihydrofolate reductase
MFSRTKKIEKIDTEQREQFEYALARIKQKQKLMRHFIVFLVGSIFLVIINPILGYGDDFFIKNWFIWALLIWAFLFLIHVFNVFIMNTFMSKEWEHKQLSKLKAKQEKRVLELQIQVEKEIPIPNEKQNQILRSKSQEDKTITMIAAAGANNELGLNNDLIWHLPDDFKRFKQLTTGHHIIMGRKTFESFPKPLPNRTHIVITRNKGYAKEGAIIAHSMEEAISITEGDMQPFIIGGGEIYKIGLEFAQKIELTRVHGAFKADTFFPEIPSSKWKLALEDDHDKDDRHEFAFSYQTFIRK